MPALSAIGFNPEFKTKYEAMVKAGRPAKVAHRGESSPPSPTPSSATGENGPPLALDPDGHHRGRFGKGWSPRQSRESPPSTK
jgi:hypothetical protein